MKNTTQRNGDSASRNRKEGQVKLVTWVSEQTHRNLKVKAFKAGQTLSDMVRDGLKINHAECFEE